MVSCSASTWAATVSGLLPQKGEWRVTKALPVGSILTETPSGALVHSTPGSRFHIQNSVALKTLRSWQVATPMPIWRPCDRASACFARQPSMSASFSVSSRTAS